jgi:hypothetical protein
VGPVFGWFDNFVLQVTTPNGRRDTHVMIHEFQMNPTYNIDVENDKIVVTGY